MTTEGTTEWPVRIHSPRLVIRPPGDADRAAMIRLMTDPVTREYLGGAVDYASRQALELSPLGLTWGRWVLASAVVLCALDAVMAGILYRYLMDFALPLTFAAALCWLAAGQAVAEHAAH